MDINVFFDNQPSGRVMITDLDNGTQYTTEEFRALTHFFIRKLDERITDKNERIAILLPNSACHAAVLLALLAGNHVYIPIHYRINNEEKCSFMLQHSGARLLLTSLAMLKENAWITHLPCRIITLEELLDDRIPSETGSFPTGNADPDALKIILYTSGTTDSPKGVMISDRGVESRLSRSFGDKDDTVLNILPYSSVSGMIWPLLMPFYCGCRVCITNFGPFLLPRFWQIIIEQNISIFGAIPSMLRVIKELPTFPEKKPKKIKYVLCGGAAMPYSLMKWYYDHWGIVLRNTWGMTETAGSVCTAPILKDLPDNTQYLGKPNNTDVEVIAVDDDGKRLPAGQKGELWIKGPGNMLGYLNNEADTRAIMKEGGFLATGDIGFCDAEGNVYFLGRSKQIIKRNGILIYPQEIEEVFYHHPNVIECACFGVEDDRFGERLIAALRLNIKTDDTSDFIAFALKALPPYKVPNEVITVKEVPKGYTGKPLINELRRIYLASQ